MCFISSWPFRTYETIPLLYYFKWTRIIQHNNIILYMDCINRYNFISTVLLLVALFIHRVKRYDTGVRCGTHGQILLWAYYTVYISDSEPKRLKRGWPRVYALDIEWSLMNKLSLFLPTHKLEVTLFLISVYGGCSCTPIIMIW